VQRFRVLKVLESVPVLMCEVELLADKDDDDGSEEVRARCCCCGGRRLHCDASISALKTDVLLVQAALGEQVPRAKQATLGGCKSPTSATCI